MFVDIKLTRRCVDF